MAGAFKKRFSQNGLLIFFEGHILCRCQLAKFFEDMFDHEDDPDDPLTGYRPLMPEVVGTRQRIAFKDSTVESNGGLRMLCVPTPSRPMTGLSRNTL